MSKLKATEPEFYEYKKKPPSLIDELLELLRRLFEYCLCCLTCGCYPGNGNGFHGDILETALTEEERVSVRNLLRYLDSDVSKHPTINDERLRALCILTYSGNQELQRSAALCFMELSERMIDGLTEIQMEPLVVLLRSRDVQIQKTATLAISNFVLNGPESNKKLILSSGALLPLIQLLHSENTEVQCNTCGCITTLATTEQSKRQLVASGGIPPLLELVRSHDLRVKRNATGALLNLTHLESSRNELVRQGALPILIDVLKTDDQEVQYYSIAALSNLAIHERHRTMMVAVGHYDVIRRLIHLLGSAREKVVCQTCLALRNLASDADNQVLIVELGSLPFLHNIIKHYHKDTLAASVACLRNLSIHKANENKIINDNFLPDLCWVVQDSVNIQAQVHAAGTLRNLAAGQQTETIIMSGAVEALLAVLMDTGTKLEVLVEVTAALAVLTDEEEARLRLLTIHPSLTLHKLLYLAKDCPNAEVSYNCAGAIGQLSLSELPEDVLHENIPGFMKYLEKFMSSDDPSNLHMALWTLNQLLRYDRFLWTFQQSNLIPLVERAIVQGESEAIQELAETALTKLKTH